jgi:hypothetical protein
MDVFMRSSSGGNFWWARCDYVNTLPDVADLPRWTRHVSENWIGLGPALCPVCCHYLPRFLYAEAADETIYRSDVTGCDALLRGEDVAYHDLHVMAKRPPGRQSLSGHGLSSMVWETKGAETEDVVSNDMASVQSVG